ncbi:LysR family transcriptional regulator [Erwinia sp. OLTSP20]|uniref:LysR family transcriptional regulator n=1 Tax=unclassified Erwinia TaxID=2622719 RepID=UPI000C18EF15|nr:MULTISPECIES: LysR family transcriptional regulator [unclassified Erwinia]PIJ50580.1 LysR family transcriptional regulator [Erwinia sp. OAMSP11]PIJ72898.1 LysR family transcriptional regulator [Erwinia sp. OLSSP12]PIJ82228.1 LysR family transcriptional regulator [Erwinia sp. OLCASP19]PIJ84781.1 LysR family transcriptional regulator [Erwinia sp. OLMTSP26]PIJ86746.1 LysR family transcriptional regulator [Erwinia sp. OLMDSP33]
MDLIQLRMFCMVAETGSLARAALALQRVPSNLTTRLRQLEQELGADLFIREKQRIRLSPLGYNFLNYARRILALSNEALDMVHSGVPAGQFALGAMESSNATRLPLLLSTFHQRYPQVGLSLTTGTSQQIGAEVRAGTLAAGLIHGTISDEALHSCVACHEELVLISCAGFPDINSPEEAANQTLFAFHQGCAYRQRLESWFQHGNVRHGPVMEIHSYHAMLACVASGAGLAIMPRSVLELLPGYQQIKIHRLADEFRHAPTLLIWRREAFTPNVQALKTLIIELFAYPPTRQNGESPGLY